MLREKLSFYIPNLKDFDIYNFNTNEQINNETVYEKILEQIFLNFRSDPEFKLNLRILLKQVSSINA
jgi:hypothetical protein